METWLNIAGLTLCIETETALKGSKNWNSFYTPPGTPDVTVRIRTDWMNSPKPDGPPVYEDLLTKYFEEAGVYYTQKKNGVWGMLTCTKYDRDCREITCWVNNVTCHVPMDTLEKVLQAIPIRAIFRRFGVLFLHTSQIRWQGKGILFTAPSGTGKTTQAKLWEKYRGAEIICNDRTLLRQVEGCWKTYGFPFDGSEPVCSGEINDLGAVVLLAQGSENLVETLHPAKTMGLLMSQMVMDVWDPEARSAALLGLAELVRDVPVYRLTCTPDSGAIRVLEDALIRDRVILSG